MSTSPPDIRGLTSLANESRARKWLVRYPAASLHGWLDSRPGGGEQSRLDSSSLVTNAREIHRLAKRPIGKIRVGGDCVICAGPMRTGEEAFARLRPSSGYRGAGRSASRRRGSTSSRLGTGRQKRASRGSRTSSRFGFSNTSQS
jgi:hypothetical protein